MSEEPRFITAPGGLIAMFDFLHQFEGADKNFSFDFTSTYAIAGYPILVVVMNEKQRIPMRIVEVEALIAIMEVVIEKYPNDPGTTHYIDILEPLKACLEHLYGMAASTGEGSVASN